jgi:hypothetical protein
MDNLKMDWRKSNGNIHVADSAKLVLNTYFTELGDVYVFTHGGSAAELGRGLAEIIVGRDLIDLKTRLLFEFGCVDTDIHRELLMIFRDFKSILEKVPCYFLNILPTDTNAIDLMNEIYDETGISISIGITDIGLWDYIYADVDDLLLNITSNVGLHYNYRTYMIEESYDFFMTVRCLLADIDGIILKHNNKIPIEHYIKLLKLLIKHGNNNIII